MNHAAMTIARSVLTTMTLFLLLILAEYFSILSWIDLSHSFPLWWKTLVLGTLLGGLLGMVGFWLLAREAVFTGLALSAGAGFGILLAALILDWFSPGGTHSEAAVYAVAIALTFLVHEMIRKIFSRQHTSAAAIAVVYLVTTAGLILTADLVPQGHHETGNLLFGNAVSVMSEDWSIGIPLASLLFIMGFVLRRPSIALIFDRTGFRLTHTRPSLYENLLQAMILLTLILAAKILGVLATFSIALFAPLTAWRQARSARSTFFASLWYGFLIFPCGFTVSFFLDLPTGACVAGVGFIVAGVAAMMAPGSVH